MADDLEMLRRRIAALFARASREAGDHWIVTELGYLLPTYPNPQAQANAAAERRAE